MGVRFRDCKNYDDLYFLSNRKTINRITEEIRESFRDKDIRYFEQNIKLLQEVFRIYSEKDKKIFNRINLAQETK